MPNFMTRKTHDRLLERLKKSKSTESRKVSQEIGEARALGDLRENAEYEAAKHKQNLLMAEIRSLEGKLADCQIIEELPIAGQLVSIGTVIGLEDLESRKREVYTILGSDDVDVENHVISYLSPLAKGLIGKKVGEEVEVVLPESSKRVKILSIQKYKA